MKKITLLFISIITIGLTYVSCNKDDDEKTAAIEGKWIFSKEGETESTLADYEHTVGCDKDYIVISSDGKITSYSYGKEGSSCIQEVYTGNWVRNGNKVTITYDEDEIYEIEIANLTNSELKTKDINPEGDDGYITVFTRG